MFRYALLSVFVYFCHIQLFNAYVCHDCEAIYLNYTANIDSLPAPTGAACRVINSSTGCFVRIGWYNERSSAVFYGANLGLPRSSVSVRTVYQVNITSSVFLLENYVAYICGDSETVPCNTVDYLRRAVRAIKLPKKDQIEQFRPSIVPSAIFDKDSCFTDSNMTTYCPEKDEDCSHCLIIMNYEPTVDICASCPYDDSGWNYFMFDSMFLLSNQSRSDRITLTCQNGARCNSIDNVQNIFETVASQFDYEEFFRSNAMIQQFSAMFILILMFFHRLT